MSLEFNVRAMIATKLGFGQPKTLADFDEQGAEVDAKLRVMTAGELLGLISDALDEQNKEDCHA